MAFSQPEHAPEDVKDRIKASYDAIAPAYNAWTAQHASLRLVYLDRLVARLRPTADGADGVDGAEDGQHDQRGPDRRPLRVLELGCGAGQPATARLLAALAPVHVTANDLSPAQIALAKATLGEHGEAAAAAAAAMTSGVGAGAGAGTAVVDWVEGDMMALGFAAGSLDAVVGLYSLIHLPRAEQATLLRRIGGWLRPGGVLLANFAAADAPGLVAERWLGQPQGWMFWSSWGADGTLAAVRAAGLAVVESRVEHDEADVAFLWVVAEKPA